ncbi:MAG: c-type cytochrome, partial [Gammaproteobacteria bacterium]|nr:c-type cytochrome [Gammaproteobacteria bacterium]
MKIIWFAALCMSSGASAESCFDTLVGHPAIAQTQRFGLGSDATTHEVARWDTDVRPDGQGLPPGSGTVMRGADVYAAQCAHCHGNQGQGIAIYDRLVGETIRDL